MATKALLLAAALSWQWTTPGDFQGWTATRFADVKAAGDRLVCVTQYDPGLVSPPLALQATNVRFATFRLKSDTSDHGELFWERPGQPMSDQSLARFQITGDNRWHTYTVDLTQSKEWRGPITRLRFDPLNKAGAKLEIMSFALRADAPGLVDDWRPAVERGSATLAPNDGQLGKVTAKAAATAFYRQRASLDWPGTYHFQTRHRGNAAPTLRVHFFDVFGKELTGSTLRRTLPPATDWTAGELEFVAPKLAASAELGLGLEGAAGSVEFAEARLRAPTPPPAPKAEAAVKWTARPPASLPRAEIRAVDGVPQLFVNGKPINAMQAMITDGAKPPLADQAARCRAAGIHLYTLNFTDPGWRPGGRQDFSVVDATFAGLLAVDPDAWIICAVAVDPYNAIPMRPWLEAHPEECAMDEQGSTLISIYHGTKHKAVSFASERWRQESGDVLRAFIRRARAMPWGERIIGWQPCGGITWEWMHWGSQGSEWLDYSAPARRAWERWLKAQGKPVVPPPAIEQRRQTDHFGQRDPVRNAVAINYARFLQDLAAESIEHFCRIVKEETGRANIVGTYYGYTTQLCGPGAERSGHFALGRLLRSPDIDFLSSPAAYSWRAVGGTGAFMTVPDSVALHGKMWINQIDHRTFRSTQAGHDESLADSVATLTREFAAGLARNVPVQWFDFSHGWTTGDDRLMQLVGRLREIAETAPPRAADTNSLAIIVDEQSIPLMSAGSWLGFEAVYYQRQMFDRAGVPYRIYLLDDLALAPRHRAYLFLNCLRYSDDQRAFIRRELQRDGRALAWVHTDGGLSGIRLERQEREAKLEINWNGRRYGPGHALGPLFLPDDPSAEVLGKTSGDNRPALVLKRHPNWTAVFSAAPMLPAELIREIAQRGGVPVYSTEPRDATYIGSRFLAVHTLEGGKRSLRVPASGTVTNLLDGRRFKVRQGELSLELPPRSTTLLTW